ncbi:MAG: hypothetical protein HYT93_03225 [Parcubacteria group bacterium]|nr:hypothetical protein [Parcubacteria group bacterium]
MKIILPKIFYGIDLAEEPLFFLAGPIRGGGDWQKETCVALQKHVPNCIIACPCRWSAKHPLSSYFTEGLDTVFERQTDWERYYLERAGTLNFAGGIIFWLPCESKKDPHPGPEPYAMDTRGELGEWRWRMKTENARVVVGAEEGFFGLSQMQRNFSKALGYDFPVYSSIEDTVEAAVALASRQ